MRFARAISFSVGAKTSLAISIWLGWMHHLPAQPSVLPQRGLAAVAVGVAVVGVGAVDGVDAVRAGGDDHAVAGVVPHVAGVAHRRVGDVAGADALAGREIADAEDQRLERAASRRRSPRRARALPSLRSAPRGRCGGRGGASLRAATSSVSTNQTSRGAFTFGTMMMSRLRAGLRDDVDDVVVRPDGVDGVDAHGADVAAPVEVVERVDDRRRGRAPSAPARRRPRGRGRRGRRRCRRPSRSSSGCEPGTAQLGAAQSGGHGVALLAGCASRLRAAMLDRLRRGSRRAVLVEQRRAAVDARRRLRELAWAGRRVCTRCAVARQLDIGEHAAGGDVRVGEDVGGGVHGADGHAAAELFDDLQPSCASSSTTRWRR